MEGKEKNSWISTRRMIRHVNVICRKASAQQTKHTYWPYESYLGFIPPIAGLYSGWFTHGTHFGWCNLDVHSLNTYFCWRKLMFVLVRLQLVLAKIPKCLPSSQVAIRPRGWRRAVPRCPSKAFTTAAVAARLRRKCKRRRRNGSGRPRGWNWLEWGTAWKKRTKWSLDVTVCVCEYSRPVKTKETYVECSWRCSLLQYFTMWVQVVSRWYPGGGNVSQLKRQFIEL